MQSHAPSGESSQKAITQPPALESLSESLGFDLIDEEEFEDDEEFRSKAIDINRRTTLSKPSDNDVSSTLRESLTQLQAFSKLRESFTKSHAFLKLRDSFKKPNAPYRRLPKLSSIRLLRLEPASSFEFPLSASFQLIDLNAPPEYSALSYVWGDPKKDYSIECDGFELKITKNLDLALRDIRSSREIVTIWVDALCINQNAILEKNHQVKNMGSIYRTAEEVLVWLGPEKPEGHEMFDCANQIVKNSEFRSEYFSSWIESPKTQLLRRLTCYEWFFRVWTFQEICLARKATILIGKQTLDWTTLYTAFKMAEDKITVAGLSNEAFYTYRVTSLFKSYQFKTFREIFHFTLERRASNALDQVYALLSHPSAYDSEIQMPIINVDYSKSLCSLYAEVTIIMFRENRNLDDLYYSFWKTVEPSSSLFPWASWIPDWSKEPKMSWLLKNDTQNFTASGKYCLENISILESVDRIPLLLASGFVVDTVENIHYIGTLKPKPISEYLKRIWDLILIPGHKRHGDAALKALHSCLTAPAELKDVAPEFEDLFITGIDASGTRLMRFQSQNTLAGLMWKHYFRQAKDRTLFVTESGYIGIGPRLTKKGDQVIILCGGKIPLMVRKFHSGPNMNRLIPKSSKSRSISRFVGIGECYISSLMHGEVENLVKKTEVRLETLVLC